MEAVGLIVHEQRASAADAASRFVAECARRGVAARPLENDTKGIQAIVGVGGDGTVLEASARALSEGLPVAGINVGRVGYLAEFEVAEIDSLAAAIAGDSLSIVERMTLSVEHEGRTATAVNDVVVEKVISQRIIEITVSISGHEFARYRTDGIIVATPLGSTAYSLSAGGPVVDPDLEALVLTPIAPHSLLSRSLVISADADVSVIVDDERPARINLDGREFAEVPPSGRVVVQRGQRTARFLTLGRHPFPQAVRHQFGLEHA